MSRGLLLLLVPFLFACESVPSLLYHHVGVDVGTPQWIPDELFREHMELIVAKGYNTITVSEMEAIELEGRSAPAQPILITFDDGYRDFYQHAYPVMRELGLKATVFLIVGEMTETRETKETSSTVSEFLTWPEARELQRHGIELQSHALTHKRLTELTAEEVAHELTESKRLLEEHLGTDISSIAYPFGSHAVFVREEAERAGYRSGYSVGAGLNRQYDRLRQSVADIDRDELEALLGGSWWGESSGLR